MGPHIRINPDLFSARSPTSGHRAAAPPCLRRASLALVASFPESHSDSREGEGAQRPQGLCSSPWHFLYFLPLPQWQGSLRPGSGPCARFPHAGPCSSTAGAGRTRPRWLSPKASTRAWLVLGGPSSLYMQTSGLPVSSSVSATMLSSASSSHWAASLSRGRPSLRASFPQRT